LIRVSFYEKDIRYTSVRCNSTHRGKVIEHVSLSLVRKNDIRRNSKREACDEGYSTGYMGDECKTI
jgi:hypothetical protein